MLNQLSINPVSFIKSISNALEISSNGISEHHRRTAIISKYIGVRLCLTQIELQTLVYAALLHDIGAAGNWDEKQSLKYELGDKIFRHAEVGYDILKDSVHLGVLAEPIRYHHDRIYGDNPSGLSGEEIPLLSRIIHVADRIEVQINDSQHIFNQKKNIIQKIAENKEFDPNIIEIVKEMEKIDAFWLDLINSDYIKDFINDADFFGKQSFDIDDMIEISSIFAKVVDTTSHFTVKHSENVATVSRELAKCIGFNKQEAEQFYLAGLLHDLGKLAVPNDILNKDGRLSEEEFMVVRQHPYYSYRILEGIEGFQVITSWIGAHHEKLDGTGYPFKLEREQVGFGSSILAMADIYCALIETRPYRESLTTQAALSIMQDMVMDDKIDENVFNILHNNASLLRSFITIEVRH